MRCILKRSLKFCTSYYSNYHVTNLTARCEFYLFTGYYALYHKSTIYVVPKAILLLFAKCHNKNKNNNNNNNFCRSYAAQVHEQEVQPDPALGEGQQLYSILSGGGQKLSAGEGQKLFAVFTLLQLPQLYFPLYTYNKYLQ